MNNKSIQILRGSQDYDPRTSEEILLDGQPAYMPKTNSLYVGSAGKALKDLHPISGFHKGDGENSIVQYNNYQVEAENYPINDTWQNIATGEDSIALGIGCLASGKRAIAVGNQCSALGNTSIVMGQACSSSGNASFVIGNSNTVLGYTKTNADGSTYTANSQLCFVCGKGSTVAGEGVFTTGMGNTITNASYNIVGGVNNTTSSNSYSCIFGRNNTHNTGNFSFISGYNNTNTGGSALVAGYSNINAGSYSTVLGRDNACSAAYNTVIGSKNTTSGGWYNTVIGADNIIGNDSQRCLIAGNANKTLAASNNSVLLGTGNVSQYYYTHLLGLGLMGSSYNDNVVLGSYNSELSEGEFFTIGQGTSESHRKSVLRMVKTSTDIGYTYLQSSLHVRGGIVLNDESFNTNLASDGSYKLTISGATYLAGDTDIINGTLKIGTSTSATSTTITTGTVTNTGGTINTNSVSVTSGGIQNNGNINIESGNTFQSGSNAIYNTGNITLSGASSYISTGGGNINVDGNVTVGYTANTGGKLNASSLNVTGTSTFTDICCTQLKVGSYTLSFF